MAFCNPKEEILALLCNSGMPFEWRDAIARALACVISLRRDDNATCDGIKECETLTTFQPIQQIGNTLIFSYKPERGAIQVRTVNVTTVINNLLNGVDSSCLMDQEDWEELTFAEKLAAIYAKACCVHGDCGGEGGEGGCDCEDCGENGDEPCIGTNACRCTQYTITGTAPFSFTYKDCTTKLVTEYESLEDDEVQICALKNSVVVPLGVLIFEDGDCGSPTTTTSTTSSTSTTTSSSSTSTTTTTTTTTSTSTTTTTTAAPVTTTTTTTSTTTSTSTTTTTTAEPLTYYLADEYDCADCSVTNSAILVTLPTSHSVQVGKFYLPVIDTGFIYNIVSPVPQSPASAIDLTTSNFTTCGGACA